ncbi:hypothetical protein MUU74_08030 [Chryseobacterium daecheongense]|uniref:DUF6759 domain-containing protein n=1 Tax=Chryseobacterium daecheongense TaxID=192389 RepID=UPI001FD65CD1|nr:DUF6759 domain-containing protein [Chryseobacterium daecheongense]UOU99889.1 hypothetical protein MUU74_08030 [Chryseobacterium daecheongense]
MKKKLLMVLLAPFILKAQKINILKSVDTQEIEKYLMTTHPDDPKKGILKRKLIALKNEAWTKGGKNSKPMAARPYKPDVVDSFTGDEKLEFEELLKKQSLLHEKRTSDLLTSMFANDKESEEAICLVRNVSNCNIIMRFEGAGNYNLPVPAGGENMLVVKKGKYSLKSMVCGTSYESYKEIFKHVEIRLKKES